MDLFGSFSLAVFTLSILLCNLEPVTGIFNWLADKATTTRSISSTTIAHATEHKIAVEELFEHKAERPESGCTVETTDGVIVRTNTRSCIVQEGTKFRFLCEWNPIYYCAVLRPNEKHRIPLNSESGFKNKTYRYYGDGVSNKGHCGIEIDSIGESHNGNFSCFMASYSDHMEKTGVISIIVPRAPKASPELLISPEPGVDNISTYYKENTTIIATCQVKDSRPASNISWYINGQEVTDSADEIEHKSSESGLVTVIQNLSRLLTWEDNEMVLACCGTHFSLQHPLQREKRIFVYFAPRLNHERIFGRNNITVQILANPKPMFSWKIGNQTILEGQSDSGKKYKVAVTTTLENNTTWQTTLELTTNISDVEAGTKFILFAVNVVGNITYEITIGEKAPAEHMTMADDKVGVIIAIVVVVLVILLIIIIVYYARITHRWCFSGTKSIPKDKIRNNDKERLQSVANSETIYSYFVEKNNITVYENNFMEQKEIVRKPLSMNGQIVKPVSGKPQGQEIVYAELDLKNVKKPSQEPTTKPDGEGTQYAVIVHKKQARAK